MLKGGSKMLGINQSTMIGILSAQNSTQMAIRNQGLADATYGQGRVRERHGITDGNQDAIEEGQKLQAKGKEMQRDTFGHLGDAMRDLNNITYNNEEYYIADTNSEKSSSDYPANADTGHDFTIDDVGSIDIIV